MTMTEDNAYKNDGSYINRRPIEREEKENKEKGEVLKEYPKIAEAIEIIEKDIAFFNTNDAVSTDVLVDPAQYMHVTAGNKQAIATLRKAKTHLEELLKTVQ